MSWKSRKRKAFFRRVDLLKDVPIYLIDQHILINEFYPYYKKNRMHVDYEAVKKSQYKKYLLDGKIKSSFDFDNYFNPDLTLDVPFEKDKRKADLLSKNALMQIGRRWDERLKSQFPMKDYTIVLYFNSEGSEWYLDFYNRAIKFEEFDSSNQCMDVIYLSEGNRRVEERNPTSILLQD